MKYTVGETMRYIRKYHDVKLSDISNNISLCRSHLSEIETSKRPPQLSILERFCKELEMSLSEFFYIYEKLNKTYEFSKLRTDDLVRWVIIKKGNRNV